jgi:hypothetical protein
VLDGDLERRIGSRSRRRISTGAQVDMSATKTTPEVSIENLTYEVFINDPAPQNGSLPNGNGTVRGCDIAQVWGVNARV